MTLLITFLQPGVFWWMEPRTKDSVGAENTFDGLSFSWKCHLSVTGKGIWTDGESRQAELKRILCCPCPIQFHWISIFVVRGMEAKTHRATLSKAASLWAKWQVWHRTWKGGIFLPTLEPNPVVILALQKLEASHWPRRVSLDCKQLWAWRFRQRMWTGRTWQERPGCWDWTTEGPPRMSLWKLPKWYCWERESQFPPREAPNSDT